MSEALKIISIFIAAGLYPILYMINYSYIVDWIAVGDHGNILWLYGNLPIAGSICIGILFGLLLKIA